MKKIIALCLFFAVLTALCSCAGENAVPTGSGNISDVDYLEEKRLRLLKRVKTEEWGLVERFKNGERFGEKNPSNALTYDEFMTFASRFKEWVQEQDY